MIKRILTPLLYVALIANFTIIVFSPVSLAESAEDKCTSEGGAWSGGKCLGKTAQARCESIGGKWTPTDATAKEDEKADNGSCDDSTLDETKVKTEDAQKARTCLGAGGVWSDNKCIQGGSITVEKSIKIIVNILTFIIGLGSVLVIVLAGFRMVTSNGDSNQVAQSRKAIIYAVVGIVVATAAYAIVNFILDALK